MTKDQMIIEILLAVKAGGGFVGGELFFTLAFRTEAELKTICAEMNINTATEAAK
jgi:hypothetical protein